MQPNVIFGNAVSEGTNRWGWFMGHFITPDYDPRSTTALEIKWGVHQAGESRTEWAVNNQAATLSILINGQFCLQFEDREINLSREGDYVLWYAGVAHCWTAQSDCTILTVRWPSVPNDSVGI
ncbi:signal peptidase I [Nostoc sp. FACHB-280]|uniref:signal peptidase I n=1 Tax=Nostoc sp. FACHB-280 TaxID=2692839 RepID=UPI00168A941F|nr:signal peptidase I [Nostoc sp. FACHB-280]MBD2497405.1 signal peptidase I [Nostoc sp. FACHB-280]